MRNHSIVVIPTLAALTLVGCTGTESPPTPTDSAVPTADTVCDPSDPATEISWRPLVEKDRAPVGYRIVTVDSAGEQTFDDTQLEYTTTVDGIEGVDDAFTDALLTDFERTGQTTSEHLGDPGTDFDSVSVTDVPAGVYLIGYRVSQIGATFTLSCDGVEGEQTGELTTSEGDELGGTLVGCGTGPTTTGDAYSESLLENCPPA